VTRFYANYQSQRFIDGRLVLRLLRLPPPEKIEELERAFSDILGPRGLQPVEATAREVAEGDELACQRLAADFNQTSFGRLRRLIDGLNAY
jgi:hypothetical protein